MNATSDEFPKNQEEEKVSSSADRWDSEIQKMAKEMTLDELNAKLDVVIKEGDDDGTPREKIGDLQRQERQLKEAISIRAKTEKQE